MVTKKKQKDHKQEDLCGIESICRFLNGVQPHVILNWKSHFGLPVYRVDTAVSFYWAARKKDLNSWLLERKIKNPLEVTRHFLEKHALQQLEKAGKQQKIERELHGADEIMRFCGRSLVTVIDWIKYKEDIPVEKKNGEYIAHADVLLGWLIKNDLISLHDVNQKREAWRKKNAYGA